ncbi:hypothetical protein AA309_20620 [Microvirga vignae]|uniref:Uncharacterized protein n=1 Tax=Microvirga vignae TaxID=1225564 RepID=A0A0H1R7W4_9HYPH|nr:hypothetical protein [Microvirga vignae]KLK91273.1 hypothetical protein AA309_20620 [Microvirga vignae]
MPRIRHRDKPDFAVDVMDGARPIGSQLVVAVGLLTVLLVAMSAVEAPMQPQDIYAAGAKEMESPSALDPKLLCSIGDKVRGWIAVTVS